MKNSEFGHFSSQSLKNFFVATWLFFLSLDAPLFAPMLQWWKLLSLLEYKYSWSRDSFHLQTWVVWRMQSSLLYRRRRFFTIACYSWTKIPMRERDMTPTMSRHEEERLQPWALSLPVCEPSKDSIVVWSSQCTLMSVARIKTSEIRS